MSNLWNVIRYEVVTTVRKRSFWLMTFLFPAGVLILSLGSSVFAGNQAQQAEQQTAERMQQGMLRGLVDPAGFIDPSSQLLTEAGIRPFDSEAAAQAALAAGEIEEYVLVPPDLMANGEVVLVVRDFSPLSSFSASGPLEDLLIRNLIADPLLAERVIDPSPGVSLRRLEPQAAPEEDGGPQSGEVQTEGISLVPFSVAFILFMSISMTGGMMLNSVAGEKENRTVEVLLLSIRPRTLMLGKLLGLGAVAILQLVIWFGATSLTLGRDQGGVGAILSFLTPEYILMAILFVLLGYFMYASILGAVGAMASSVREGSQFSFLVLFPLFIVLITNNLFGGSPDGLPAVIMSLFPLTAPLAMVIRLSVTTVPFWQVLLSMAGLAACSYLAVLVAARFFRPQHLLSGETLAPGRILAGLFKGQDPSA